MLKEMVAWQRPSPGADEFDRLPGHRRESPAGYSSAGCSPAEPTSASPVTDRVAAPDPAMQSNALLNRPLPCLIARVQSRPREQPLADGAILSRRTAITEPPRANDEAEPMITAQATTSVAVMPCRAARAAANGSVIYTLRAG